LAIPSDDVGPTLEILSLDACRLAARLVEAAEADALRRMTDHGRIALTSRFVRSLIAARQLRSERLGPALAPEPGWSVLLVLYFARLEGFDPTLAALTRAAAAPGATVYGRIVALEAEGLIERRPDPSRGRGTLVRLTDEAAARIHDYLREAREI
jgi:DNA-binding MarR family transcriptional regulator